MMYVVHWKYRGERYGHGIVGVFDEKAMAEAVFDALEAADVTRTYYLDDYTLNQVKK